MAQGVPAIRRAPEGLRFLALQRCWSKYALGAINKCAESHNGCRKCGVRAICTRTYDALVDQLDQGGNDFVRAT